MFLAHSYRLFLIIVEVSKQSISTLFNPAAPKQLEKLRKKLRFTRILQYFVRQRLIVRFIIFAYTINYWNLLAVLLIRLYSFSVFLCASQRVRFAQHIKTLLLTMYPAATAKPLLPNRSFLSALFSVRLAGSVESFHFRRCIQQSFWFWLLSSPIFL